MKIRQNGFLKKRQEFKPVNIIGGLLLWILTAYIFYAFFQIFRESFRLFTAFFGDRAFLVLTNTENYTYNLFYAAVASALGYAFALRFTLQSSQYKFGRKTKSVIRRTLNMEGFFTWTFLFWFGKLGSMLGIWYTVYAMQYDLNWIKNFSVILILLPVICFYSTWPSFNRLVPNNKAKWFVGITITFIIMSFGFAFKNFTDYQKINKNILSNSIEHVFDLKKAKSKSQQRLYRLSLVIDIYIVKDTLNTEEPVIFFNHIENRVGFQGIKHAVAVEKSKIFEWDKHNLTANLHVDKRIKMEQIKPILNELREAELRKIQFSTAVKHSRYPADYPVFKYSGIQKTLNPKYFYEFENFLDSVENIDLIGKTIKIPESRMYRNSKLKGFNRVRISLTPDTVMLNGQAIEPLKLANLIYGFIKKYSPTYRIIFNVEDNVRYKRYIQFLDLLYTQLDRLRNELSLESYNQPYNYWYRQPERDSIEKQFPMRIVEFSIEEERLHKLIKKIDSINP